MNTSSLSSATSAATSISSHPGSRTASPSTSVKPKPPEIRSNGKPRARPLPPSFPSSGRHVPAGPGAGPRTRSKSSSRVCAPRESARLKIRACHGHGLRRCRSLKHFRPRSASYGSSALCSNWMQSHSRRLLMPHRSLTQMRMTSRPSAGNYANVRRPSSGSPSTPRRGNARRGVPIVPSSSTGCSVISLIDGLP